MRVACLNQDAGIAPGRHKGAAVHLRAMREAFATLGADVVSFDEPDGAKLTERALASFGETPFDLIYERYALGGAHGAELARELGIPFVLEVNAPLAEEEERWRDGVVPDELLERERRVFESAVRIVAVSTQVGDYAIERGAARQAVQVFPNGVDTELFRPPRPSDPPRDQIVPAGCFVLGFHGRVRPWHGFERLVDACERLLRRGLPVHLLIVGAGDFGAALDASATSTHHTLVDWVPHEAVGRYVSCFDALPLTYGDDVPCYFSPLKLAEAMACGAVPVVPRVGDLYSVVAQLENGLVYPAGDVDALVDSLAWLIADPEARRRLGRAAVKSAEQLCWTRAAAFALGQVEAGV